MEIGFWDVQVLGHKCPHSQPKAVLWVGVEGVAPLAVGVRVSPLENFFRFYVQNPAI